MHLLKILELLHILRNNPEPAEGVIAEASDPTFVAAEGVAAAMLTPQGFGQSIAVTGDTLPPPWFGHYEMILRPACLGTLPRRLFGQATQRHIGQPTAVMISTRYLRFALGGHPIFSDLHIQ